MNGIERIQQQQQQRHGRMRSRQATACAAVVFQIQTEQVIVVVLMFRHRTLHARLALSSLYKDVVVVAAAAAVYPSWYVLVCVLFNFQCRQMKASLV